MTHRNSPRLRSPHGRTLTSRASSGRNPDRVRFAAASPSPSVTLADFGVAKQLALNDGLTETGKPIGTPESMAPEQVGGRLFPPVPKNAAIAQWTTDFTDHTDELQCVHL